MSLQMDYTLPRCTGNSTSVICSDSVEQFLYSNAKLNSNQ